MRVYINRITGIDDAIVSLHMSKRSWSRELENNIRKVCKNVLNYDGSLNGNANEEDLKQFNTWMTQLTRWGTKHITLLRFIDLSITVEGLHRAGQDDWDSHAMRFDNRIVRSSTRIKGSDFKYEISDYYSDKIIPTDVALKFLDMTIPDEITIDGTKYVKAVNGYIVDGMENNPDVKRGLYMLSIPSNFIFKINMTEWGHVFKERNEKGTANPEVKQCCEMIADQIEEMHSQFNRQLFNDIKN